MRARERVTNSLCWTFQEIFLFHYQCCRFKMLARCGGWHLCPFCSAVNFKHCRCWQHLAEINSITVCLVEEKSCVFMVLIRQSMNIFWALTKCSVLHKFVLKDHTVQLKRRKHTYMEVYSQHYYHPLTGHTLLFLQLGQWNRSSRPPWKKSLTQK